MKIHGVVVCVDYADLLAVGLPRWLGGCDTLTVITTPADEKTRDLVHGTEYGALVFLTDAFYEQGAVFNKGLAMSRYFQPRMRQRPVLPLDWVLTFDADVVPPADWRQFVEQCAPRPGNLYGAYRAYRAPTPEEADRVLVVREPELAGFFQLWHVSDPYVHREPLYDCTWRHAGGYDSEFQSRWPADQRIKLPLLLEHQGLPGRNWWGRGNDAAMDRMIEIRNRTGQYAPEERA